jgi:alanine-synthesizing transaminase
MVSRSSHLSGVNYEIRGPIYEQAVALEKAGHSIIKFHIGNPAPFGFQTPAHIQQALTDNLGKAQGYAASHGIAEAREAVARHYTNRGFSGISEDTVFIGNGVSDLIMLSMQALLEKDDEILVPTPDYPLWTSTVRLCGGRAVHYACDPQADWMPDLADIRRKITSRTRGLVIINPNNPTGAVYSRELLEGLLQIAREHNLIVFSDEIYDRILYDGATHTSIATLADDVLCLTMSGLTKNYFAAGFRAGWLVLSGKTVAARDYMEGLMLLATMRVCSSVPAQYCIKPALEGYQHIDDLVKPGGRLYEQRNAAVRAINAIPGLSCVTPKGAFYLFAKIDPQVCPIESDKAFVMQVLRDEKVLLVQGTGFNHTTSDHFRVVFLPSVEQLTEGIGRIGRVVNRISEGVLAKPL